MKVRSAASALIKYGGEMPPRVVSKHRTTIAAYLGRPASEDDLRTLKDLEYTTPNPAYVPPSKRLVTSLKSEVEMAEFVRGWRRFFVDSFRPRNMPEGWRVEARVTNDGRVAGARGDGGRREDRAGGRPALHPLVESILTSPGTVPHPSGLTLENLAASPIGDEFERPPEEGMGDEDGAVRDSFGDVRSGGYESPPRSNAVVPET